MRLNHCIFGKGITFIHAYDCHGLPYLSYRAKPNSCGQEWGFPMWMNVCFVNAYRAVGVEKNENLQRQALDQRKENLPLVCEVKVSHIKQETVGLGLYES